LSTEDQYADTKLDLDAAHAISTGVGMTVAIVDTGIQLLPNPHPDLAGVTGPGVDFVDGDGVPDDEANGVDDNGDGAIDEGAGHGTFIAGIVHRVAPDATILPVRVLDSEGEGSEWDVAKGMFWAADHGADVVNVSAGRHNSASLLVHAVDTLQQLGVVVVVAAGNDGRNRNELPALADCALAVTGTGPTDKVSKFSTLGGWVDVGAPAEAIHSTFPFFATGYASWNGTSFAAPFATGQVALLRSLSPQLTVGDVLSYVKGTTVPYNGVADKAGFGRIAPDASLVALQHGARPDPHDFDVRDECFQ
jgi:subtilisin family serine protease